MSKVAPSEEKIPLWHDVSSHLDPMMSKDDYEQVRFKFFQDVIRPRIPRGESSSEVYKEFQRRTERSPLLSAKEKAGLQLRTAATSAVREMVSPFQAVSSSARDTVEALERKQAETDRILAREGSSSNVAKVAGAVGGGILPMAAAFTVAEPLGAGIAAKAFTSATTVKRVGAVLSGGLAFGALDALSDKTGNRLVSGVKGVGTGMLWTLPFAPFLHASGLAKSLSEAEKLGERAYQEPDSVPQQVHEAIAKKLYTDSQIITQQEILPNSIVRNPKIRGVLVSLLPREGTGVRSIEVRPGRESDALAQIRKAQEAGAEFNALHFNPSEEARAFRFLREARDSELWKYDESTIVEVQKGLADQIAKQAREEGIPASSLTDSQIELHVKREERELLPHEEEAKLSSEKTLAQDLNREIESAKETVPKMPVEKAKELAAKYGYDPEKVDLEAIRTTGEAELSRLMEVRDRSRQSGKEFDPLGQRSLAEKMSAIDPKLRRKNADKTLNLMYKEIEQSAGKLGFTIKDVVVEASNYPESWHQRLGISDSEFIAKVNAYQSADAENIAKLLEEGKEGEKSSVVEGALPTEQKALEPVVGRGPMFLTLRKLASVPTGSSVVDSIRDAGIGQVSTPNMKISFHPFRASIQVPQSVYERLNPGTTAVLYQKWRTAMNELGVKLPRNISENYPAMMFTKKSLTEEKFHEFLHAGIVKTGLTKSMDTVIPPESRLHAFAIATRLETAGPYKGRSFGSLLDETFAYAATAIRYGNTKYGQDWLETLTKWNGSEEHIKQLVRGTAENILKHSQGKLDSVSERILQRKMNDLIRRSDTNISYNISTVGESARWNPESLGWQIREGDVVHNLKTSQDVWDFILNKDISDTAPSFTSRLEALGIRGPMAVIPPIGRTPMPTVGIPAEERWRGWAGWSGWFRPFLPWVATTDKKINRALQKRGESFPLFDKVKLLDDRVREGDRWLDSNAEKIKEALKGVPSKKQNDYFSTLSYEPKDFGQAASKYSLTPKDIERVHKMEEWATEFSNDTGIDVFQYLRKIQPKLQHYGFAPESLWSVRYDPKSAGFWEKAVREKGLDPSDNHLGRFVQWVMKEGWEKKFTGKPIEDLQKLIDFKVGEKGSEKQFLSSGLKGPLQNYINYIKGIPDQTQVIINQGMRDFAGKVQDKIKQINTHLPEGMKIPGSEANISPRLLQRLMALTYAAGLGLRPAIAIRDGLQVLTTTLPVLGARKFSRGMELMFSSKGRELVDQAGGFLGRTNIGELYGDISREIPTEGRVAEGLNRFANLMMSPSRWGHNFSRGITFLGEYDSALKSIKALREGTLTQANFLRETSLWFMDDQVSSKLLLQAQGKEDLSSVAKQIALETVDLTQFPYRRGTQPAMLRTGLGRIFGQFGMWPMNYADFLARLTKKSAGGEYRQQALRSAGLWVASNYAATSGMEALGADVGKWFFLSPAGYSPSMHFDLVKDLALWPEETDEGRAARKRVLTYPLNFIPARVELESILRVMENQPEIGTKQGALDPRLIRVLGFRPTREMPSMTPEETAEYELGFKGVRAPVR